MVKESAIGAANEFFNPEAYVERIDAARAFIQEQLPKGFVPRVALTLGSGGLGVVAHPQKGVIEAVAEPILYEEIPGFPLSEAPGHKGELVAGSIAGVPMIGLRGRKHLYEIGGQPNLVMALKEVTFAVYVARALGAEVYFATNAAGGLDFDSHNPGDLMVITSHLSLLYPNPLLGPQVDFEEPQRFQPQNDQYDAELTDWLLRAGRNAGEIDKLRHGVYAAVPGPTYESKADSQYLRSAGVDAVGMSTVPEVIVASNINMRTAGFSLIANVIARDGTNATSIDEVEAALNDPTTVKRVLGVTEEFFKLYSEQVDG